MRSKLLIRQLPALNSDKLKANLLEQRKNDENNQGNESLKHIMECMIQMNQQMKEIKIKLNQFPQKLQPEAGPRKDPLLSERMEKRFQDVNLPIPKLGQNLHEEERVEKILSWLSEVCKTVFSIGFDLYETGVLNINKVKAYCSENVLRNLIYFSRQNQLTQKQIGSINEFLQKDLLPYFCQKYPESEQMETSAKFTSDLIQRDEMESSNDYDLVYKSKVEFNYQESGNYNSQIMKFLNYIISLPNKLMPVSQDGEKNGKKQKPLNELFFQDMESIFKLVQVENNTINMKKYNPKNPVPFQWSVDTSSEKEKQEYQQKVKSYTSYQIGQKLSKNFKPFSDLEIESGNLTLKNAEIIRILTKWCEELEKYFEKISVLSDRENLFRMKDGSQNRVNYLVAPSLRSQLFSRKDSLIKNIQEQIQKNNYKHQSSLFSQDPHKELSKFSEGEAEVGQFASYIFKNNQHYLVKYLNALIHGMAMTAQNLVKNRHHQRNESPQLITFNIGDLMRCKCSSKENQIIALYKEIQRRHRQPNSGIKIIRVKNRLNKGNKDILMNLLYRGEMVVEMQLAIKSDKSKFIECSYNFNHYLYELKRAQFGPIMEMCNVWVSKDLKAQFYLEKVEKLNKRKKKKEKQRQIKGTCCEYANQMIRLPFRCNLCSCFYFSSSEAERNIYCEECDRYICFLCQLENSQKERKKLLKDIKELKDEDLDKIQIVQKIPKTGGMLVNLKSREKKGLLFLTVQQNDDENHLFQYRQGIAKLIVKLNSQTFSEEFLKQNLVLTSEKIQQQVIIQKNKGRQAISRNFVQKYLKDAFDNEKSSIFLSNKNMKQENLTMPKIEYFPNVKTINFSKNKDLRNFSKAVQQFPNTQQAVLNGINAQKIPEKMWKQIRILRLEENQINTILNLTQCQKLQELYLRQNNLFTLPNEIEKLNKLKILNLERNNLTNLPTTIGSLKFLQTLVLESNHIKQLPAQIGGMVSLKKLSIAYNQTLKQIPESIGELTNLQQLKLSRNCLKQLPSSIGKLTQLKKLIIDINQLTELPPEIGNLRQLTHLNLSRNAQLVLPEQLGQLQSLQELRMEYNDISYLPSSVCKLKNLKIFNAEHATGELPKSIGSLLSVSTLDLSEIKCGQIPEQIGQLRKLENLEASYMGLSVLPDSIGELQSLFYLVLRSNLLTSLPQSFGGLRSLQRAVFWNNKLSSLPESIGKLQHLKQLYLTKNQLKSLPETFGQLESLQHLQLNENKFEIFPEPITRLKSLQYLGISQNKLKSLPQSICHLRYLHSLQIKQNLLQQLPCKLPKSLRGLSLARNQNLTVSQQIFKYKYLKYLAINVVDQAGIETFAAQVAASSTSLSRLQVYKKGSYVNEKGLQAKINQLTQGKVSISLCKYSE